MYKYLRLIFNTWCTILIYIDRDSDVIDLYNKVNIEKIKLFIKDEYKYYKLSNNCLYILECIYTIHEIIELYIQNDYPMYTFFKLTNIVKYNETNNIDKYKNLFKIPIDDDTDTTELDFSINIKKPNIKYYIEKFIEHKTNLFENEFINFIN
jgi:hypothetical protein